MDADAPTYWMVTAVKLEEDEEMEEEECRRKAVLETLGRHDSLLDRFDPNQEKSIKEETEAADQHEERSREPLKEETTDAEAIKKEGVQTSKKREGGAEGVQQSLRGGALKIDTPDRGEERKRGSRCRRAAAVDQPKPCDNGESKRRRKPAVEELPSSSDESQLDELSEPDSDLLEWLPCGSPWSSRASSADDPERRDCASPVASEESPDCASTPVPTTNQQGGSSSAGCVQDSCWRQANWKPNHIPFTATPGARGAAAQLNSNLPADFLELFLTKELLLHIVEQTNLYAKQHFQAFPERRPHSRGNAWKPVSVQELKTFFGLSFLTGYVKKPSIELYWSVNEIDATPYFSQTMSRNRYQIIWRFLHYNNNASRDASDKLYKVRPVLDYIVKKFRELYQPGQNICIDEGMMQWRGRLSFRVYDPQKPVKNGLKSYVLCDSATGYCFNMHPYVGESSTLPDIVFHLLDRLPGHGYKLFMNDFYNSVLLCDRLLAAQTNVCGTLKKNRGEPKVISNITKTDLGPGARVVQHNGKVMVTAWQDKCLVKILTTCHEDRMERVEVWQRGHKARVAQMKPECVVAHNASMNGVDKLDHNISYYPFLTRSFNWSKKFVAYLFQVSMFNAYVLYKQRNPGQCKNLLEFIRQVVRSWTAKRHVGEEGDEKVPCVGVEAGGDVEEGRPTSRAPYNTDPESRLDGLLGRHKLEYLVSITGKKSRPSRRCRVCSRKGRRSETKMWCVACCVPLHAGECFTAYHTKAHYQV